MLADPHLRPPLVTEDKLSTIDSLGIESVDENTDESGKGTGDGAEIRAEDSGPL